MNNNDVKKALCRRLGMKTSMFFEDFEEMTHDEREKVLAVCSNCEVAAKCREDGEAQKEGYGVWGGVFFKKGRIVRLNSSSIKTKKI